jgi:DtxR family Mn-dependent transcriptional regulator
MVRKLEGETLASYEPYHGVVLTVKGEQIAASLVRRHRIWERFLADMLAIPWESTHAIAGQLEHAAPDLVTERLAGLMGEPELCPHGSAIPPRRTPSTSGKTPSSYPLPGGEGFKRVSDLAVGDQAQVKAISPEVPEYLCRLQAWGIIPGTPVKLSGCAAGQVSLLVNGAPITIPADLAQTIWTGTVHPQEPDDPSL